MGVPHWVYLLAALQWGILAPLNVIKVLRNTPTKFAHHFVAPESEQCQKDCGIARMWATMFWSCQCAFSLGYLHIYLYRSAKKPFVPIAIFQKVFVGAFLIKANMDGVVRMPPAVGGVLDWVMACILLFDIVLPPTLPTAAATTEAAPAPGTTRSGVVRYLLQFAAQPWYPWLVGALSGLNNFTVVLSAPLVVLYLAGVLAKPSRRWVAAFANAVGTTIGVAVLMYLLSQNSDYIRHAFPSVFASPKWAQTEWAVTEYGWAGAFFISIQPIFLQPLVAICCLAEMNRMMLLGCVLAGRTLKYIIMAELAYAGDERLGYFGSAAVTAAESLKKDA